MKTIFLCHYLTDNKLRVEIHEGLNVIENWNSANDTISFGNRAKFRTNDPVLQEMIILSLHLLQNTIILANTMMVDSVIHEKNLMSIMVSEDFSALTPLFTSNINPYGDYRLDLNKPSFMAVN